MIRNSYGFKRNVLFLLFWKIFYWKFIYKFFIVGEILIWRGILIFNLFCFLCGEDKEILVYIFMDCYISKRVWMCGYLGFWVEVVVNVDISDWIFYFIDYLIKLRGLEFDEMCYFVVIFYFIWLYCNDVVFCRRREIFFNFFIL